MKRQTYNSNMRLRVTALLLTSLIFLTAHRLHAEEGGDDQMGTLSAQESEERGILPDGVATSSSALITPVTSFPEKMPYQQAVGQLNFALTLWKNGRAEAASDAALEAYDDLCNISHARGVRRSKIREQRHQAASVYVVTAIATIKQYVKDHDRTPEAQTEGRERLEDLRDVGKNYRELNHLITAARDQL